jgi:uncharacterized protein YggE
VTIRELASISDILDVVIGVGANSIYWIWFGLRDTEATYTQAMQAAVFNAQECAEAIA